MEPNKSTPVLSDEEKVAKAQEYKDRGNAAFKAGELHKAKGSYHRAILYLKGLSINSPSSLTGMATMLGQAEQAAPQEKMTPETLAVVSSLSCDCHNNLAACLLKDTEPKFSRVVELCDTALESSPGNVKAIYRKGSSLYALGDYDQALATLQQAAAPDSSIRKQMSLCKAAIKEQDKSLAQTYRNMFIS